MDKFLSLIARHRRIAYPVAGLVMLLALSGGVVAASGTFSSTPTASPTATTAPTATPAGGNGLGGFPAAGGASNIVQVFNSTDSFFKSDGRMKVSQTPGPNVGPKNEALAYGSCTNCNTLAVALQIDVRNANARNVQPQNAAVAVNFQCNGCQTGAIAIQDVIPVADPTQIPSNVRAAARQIDADFRALRATLANGNYSLLQAIGYVDSVIIPEFNALAGQLDVKRDVESAPTTPGASPMAPSSSASPSATVSGSPTESPTPTPSASSSP